MAIAHTIRSVDTVESLANNYFGDSEKWGDIVEYNALDYPYIVTEDKDKLIMYAHGILRIRRRNTRSRLVIRKGSTFRTASDVHGIIKQYESIDDTVLDIGEAVGFVNIRCVVKGSFGNTIADTITHTDHISSNIGIDGSTLEVTNPAPISNGRDIRVLSIGELIYIPTEDRGLSTVDSPLSDNYLEELGGIDIANPNGKLVISPSGDLKTVAGVSNIEQAVVNRLMTERGSDPINPDYGTELYQLIGERHTPYLVKLIELDIIYSLSYEDRIEEVIVDSIELDGSNVRIVLTLVVSETLDTFEGSRTDVAMDLVLRF